MMQPKSIVLNECRERTAAMSNVEHRVVNHVSEDNYVRTGCKLAFLRQHLFKNALRNWRKPDPPQQTYSSIISMASCMAASRMSKA
jgi:hypothetical protein